MLHIEMLHVCSGQINRCVIPVHKHSCNIFIYTCNAGFVYTHHIGWKHAECFIHPVWLVKMLDSAENSTHLSAGLQKNSITSSAPQYAA